MNIVTVSPGSAPVNKFNIELL